MIPRTVQLSIMLRYIASYTLVNLYYNVADCVMFSGFVEALSDHAVAAPAPIAVKEAEAVIHTP